MRLFYTIFCWILASGVAFAEPIKVVVSTSFLADITAEIGGEKAIVTSILPIGTDPHIYDPVPEDARKIAKADLLIINGLTLEGWIREMMDNAGTSVIRVVATDGIEPIQSSEYESAFDPHAWMNPLNAIVYASNIRDGLIATRPDEAAYFESRYQAYEQQLRAIDAYVKRKMTQVPESKRVLATSHDAFRYYGNHYGLEVVSILGTSTEAEPTLEAYQALLHTLSDKQIPAVFVESTINPKLLQRLADDLGIVIGGELFADSLGDEESGADTYLKMIRQNTDIIVRGLLGLAGGREEDGSWFLVVVIGLFGVAFGFVAWRLRRNPTIRLDQEPFHLEIRGLTVSYEKKTAISNVYLNIESGHVYGLLGGNGSGKSTLFKSVLGLVEPDSGFVSIASQPIDDIRSQISYIPQKEEIDWSFPATVFDIVLMGRYPHRQVFQRIQSADRQRALEALSQMGISDLKNKQIGELSGGQQQRAFIARALCQDADIFLFDEPFVGVDITTESRIMEIVKELAASGKLVIIIHHDLAKVQEYFDRVIMINQRVVTAGATEEVFNDENIRKTYGGQLTILQKTELFK